MQRSDTPASVKKLTSLMQAMVEETGEYNSYSIAANWHFSFLGDCQGGGFKFIIFPPIFLKVQDLFSTHVQTAFVEIKKTKCQVWNLPRSCWPCLFSHISAKEKTQTYALGPFHTCRPIGPPIVLYGVADVSGYLHTPGILSDKIL